MDYGKKFAELRDKLREQHEVNKISHVGAILEQPYENSVDRYLLIASVEKGWQNLLFRNFTEEKQNEDDVKVYYVKSLTSKTLIKLIKNKGAYKEFHSSKETVNHKKIKKEWGKYQDEPELTTYLKDCLENSSMATEQKWGEFGFDFSNCKTYQTIEKEIDSKGHILKEEFIPKQKITEWVENDTCLLFPFVNQDITSQKRVDKNQFSKDWRLVFEKDNGFRLHPEFQITYRQPTPGYPYGKRHSRFQMNAHLGCEIHPQNSDYLRKKDQLSLFNNQTELKDKIDKFNNTHKPKSDYFVFGIDRGEKKLAVLCVLDSQGVIQGDFEIYKREFNENKKQWEHFPLEKRNILDLSNLRVESTTEGKKVLVDLSEINVHKRDSRGKIIAGESNNRQMIKLKQLAYRRKLQYVMQDKEYHKEMLTIGKLN